MWDFPANHMTDDFLAPGVEGFGRPIPGHREGIRESRAGALKKLGDRRSGAAP